MSEEVNFTPSKMTGYVVLAENTTEIAVIEGWSQTRWTHEGAFLPKMGEGTGKR